MLVLSSTFLLFLILSVLVMLFFILSQFRRLPEEKGEKLIYEELSRTGFIGEWRYKGALRLSIYENFLL